MSDDGPRDPDLDPDLDPVVDERVRALLAGIGDPGQPGDRLPDEVADRLDDTLAALVAERAAADLSSEHTATGEVVPLRPRWMPRLAAGAAAVVVLGLGGVVAAGLGHLGTGSETAKGSAGSGGGVAESRVQSDPQSDDGSGTPSAGADTKGSTAAGALPELSSAGFRRDVAALLSRRPSLRAPARLSHDTGSSTPAARPGCTGPRVTDGAAVTPVVLDGTPAAVVVHPPRAGRRVVEAWSCDGTRRLASTTLAP